MQGASGDLRRNDLEAAMRRGTRAADRLRGAQPGATGGGDVGAFHEDEHGEQVLEESDEGEPADQRHSEFASCGRKAGTGH